MRIMLSLLYNYTVLSFVIDESLLGTMNCLTFSLGQNCISQQSESFSILFEEGSGICSDLRPPNFISSTIQPNQSICVPVISSMLCYRANLMYDKTIIDTQSNLNFNACPVSALSSFVASGLSMQLNGDVTNGNVSHLTSATVSCTSFITDLSGSPQITCIDGIFQPVGFRSCVCKSFSMCFMCVYIICTFNYYYV